LRVGFLTIGQSPRPDITSDLPKTLSSLEVIEAGALDDFSGDQIVSLRPRENETVYVSRLRDGSEVQLARERLAPLLRENVGLLRRNGARSIVLLCSGEFDLGTEESVVFPSKLLRSAVECQVRRKSRLGVLVPGEAQVQDAEAEWSELAQDVKALSFSPYADSADSLKASAKALSDRDVIVMDCIGYTREHRRMTRRISGKPVIAARTIAFRFLEELYSEDSG